MVFEEVKAGELPVGKYWSPEQVGDYVEGNILGWEVDDYGNNRIVLELADGNETRLPGHRNLVRYNKNLQEGDYIRVEVTKIIPPRNGNKYPMMVYKVLKDPERAVVYEEIEEMY